MRQCEERDRYDHVAPAVKCVGAAAFVAAGALAYKWWAACKPGRDDKSQCPPRIQGEYCLTDYRVVTGQRAESDPKVRVEARFSKSEDVRVVRTVIWDLLDLDTGVSIGAVCAVVRGAGPSAFVKELFVGSWSRTANNMWILVAEGDFFTKVGTLMVETIQINGGNGIRWTETEDADGMSRSASAIMRRVGGLDNLEAQIQNAWTRVQTNKM